MAECVKWPQKTRQLEHPFVDSTIWDDVEFRDDDIVIVSWAKSGTTWMQQLVRQLLVQGDPDPDFDREAVSPYVDLYLPPKAETLKLLEELQGRRFLKTHLPLDALVFSPKAKYIYVARDGRDMVWSLHNHFKSSTPKRRAMFSKWGLPVEPTPDILQFWREWMDRDGYPMWPFWPHVRGWWDVRHLPNVKLIHFANLQRDFEGEARGLAEFLGIPVEEGRWADIVKHCSLEWMKRIEKGSELLTAEAYVNKGTNGRWRGTLTEAECQEYESRAVEKLGQECARWLATGEVCKGH